MDRFCDVTRLNCFRLFKIGDRARHFAYSVERSGREAQFIDRLLLRSLLRRLERAVALHLRPIQMRIVMRHCDFDSWYRSSMLNLPSLRNSLPDDFRRFRFLFSSKSSSTLQGRAIPREGRSDPTAGRTLWPNSCESFGRSEHWHSFLGCPRYPQGQGFMAAMS